MSGAEFRYARTERLRAALAHGHDREYHTDATFRSCIDTLAGMLVPMIDGLAAACVTESAEMSKRHTEVLAEILDADMRRHAAGFPNPLRKDT